MKNWDIYKNFDVELPDIGHSIIVITDTLDEIETIWVGNKEDNYIGWRLNNNNL